MPARTTAILNLKGGVAKTTTAINMAAILAKDYGARVLLIDADSQANLTEFFDVDPTGGSLAMVLRGASLYKEPGEYAASCIQHTHFKNVDLLPADDTLMDLDLSKVEQGTVNSYVLRYLVEEVKDRYAYILIDCPPAFNAASAAALIAADDVIIPIKLDAFSLRGMGNLMRQIRNMRQINPRLRLAGCLPTMWYRDLLIEDAERQLREAKLPIYPRIRRSDKVDTMTWKQEPLVISSPKSSAGVDYRRFIRVYTGGRSYGGKV